MTDYGRVWQCYYAISTVDMELDYAISTVDMELDYILFGGSRSG